MMEMSHYLVEIKHLSAGKSLNHKWISFVPVVLLLLCSCAFKNGFCDDFNTMVSVPLGFEINGMDQSNNFWVSGNGIFAFGFLKKDDLDSCEVGIWYNLVNSSANLPVWTVGGGVKVSLDSSIRLDLDGRLVLVQNQNGKKIVLWSSDTSSLGVSKASLLDNGNLVLLDSKDEVLWESFSSPTNILLPGQSFHYPQNLRALSMKSTLSYYSLVMSKSGELRLVWEHNVTYWKSPIGPNVLVKEARFDNDGVLGLFDDYDKVVWSVSSNNLGDLSTRTLRHLSLDQDGNLRIYSWDNVTREWEAGWQAVQEQCNVFGSCGLYSLCGYNSTSPVCWCLYSLSFGNWDSAFSPIAADLAGGAGCQKMVDLANCRMRTSMVAMKQTVLYGIYPPIDIEMFLSEKDCREYCTNDSTCIAVTSMNDGSGKCTVKRTSFISGYNSHSVAAISFLKVCSVPQAAAAQMNSNNNAGLVDSSVAGRKKASGANIRFLIGAVALISFITVAVVVSLELFVIWIMHRRGQIKPQTRIPFGKDARMNPHYSALIRLSFEEIKELTNNFATPLGSSYFKGTLPNKIVVAAKLLNDIVVSEKDFRVAVSTLGGTHHRNLALIKGFCFEPKHKILLYEYIPNGSLDKWLLSPEKDGSKRAWQERLQVAIGITHAIAYLHTECQQCIIHGNLKLENILLDENLVPKLTDFGLRTLIFKEGVASSSAEMPSEKDIYMLGMLILQIVTCKREVIQENVHRMLDKLFDQKEIFDDIDEFKSVERVMKIAIWCMQDQPFLRPSISEVVKVLEGTLSVDRPPSGFITNQSIAVDTIEGEES